jgi:hypothetical protein
MDEINLEQRIPLIVDGRNITIEGREFSVINGARSTTVSKAQGSSVEIAIQAVGYSLWRLLGDQCGRILTHTVSRIKRDYETNDMSAAEDPIRGCQYV